MKFDYYTSYGIQTTTCSCTGKPLLKKLKFIFSILLCSSLLSSTKLEFPLEFLVILHTFIYFPIYILQLPPFLIKLFIHTGFSGFCFFIVSFQSLFKNFITFLLHNINGLIFLYFLGFFDSVFYLLIFFP